MLKTSEINFPITFHLPDMGGRYVTFHSNDNDGAWNSGNKCDLGLSYFIIKHNKQNPSNDPKKQYYYEMAEKKDKKREGNALLDALNYPDIKPGQVINDGVVFPDSIVKIDCICNIEHMPVGATIVGIQRECGGWDDLKFKPRRIEVHDDVICLLSGYTSGYKSGNNYGAEINIKRGTKVKYSTNC